MQLGDTGWRHAALDHGLSGHDGCHYAYLGGYRDMGDHTFAVLARDLYGGPSAGVAPPEPVAVSRASGSQLVVQLRSTDPLTVEAGAAADFRVEGAAVTVSSVAYQPGGKLVLTLSGPATGATALIVPGHIGAGPWITNATGRPVGLHSAHHPSRYLETGAAGAHRPRHRPRLTDLHLSTSVATGAADAVQQHRDAVGVLRPQRKDRLVRRGVVPGRERARSRGTRS